MSAPFKLSRRSVLRAGAVTLALPPLEVMFVGKGAHAATAPKRFVAFFAGIATGLDGATVESNPLIPKTAGPLYVPGGGLTPLVDLQVKGDVAVVTGLSIPKGTGPAARFATPGKDTFHGTSVIPQMCGGKARDMGNGNPDKLPSADSIVGEQFGAAHKYKTIALSVQPHGYAMPLASGRHHLSFAMNGSLNSAVASPAQLFASLFGTAAGTVASGDAALTERTRQKSILDYLADRTNALRSKLGKEDNARLTRHYDEIRALEKRLDAVPATGCPVPLAPVEPAKSADAKGLTSNEEARATLMVDLLVKAFVCDQAVAAAVSLSWSQSFMGGAQIAGNNLDLHQIHHNYGDWNLAAKTVGWHVKHFARLVSALKATTDFDGKKMLENSAVVLCFDGGHGTSDIGGAHSTHSSDNMVVLAAGKSGGLRTDKGHIPSGGKHPGQVTLAALRSLGVTRSLGDLRVPLPELMA